MEDVWDEEEKICRDHTGDVLLEGDQGQEMGGTALTSTLCRELWRGFPRSRGVGFVSFINKTS